jgi:hypothetical protein
MGQDALRGGRMACRWLPLLAAMLCLAARAGAQAPDTKPPPAENPRQVLSVPLPEAKPPPAEPMRQVLTVEAPTAKPPPAEVTAADIAGPGCAPGHRALLDEGLAEARRRLAAAIRMVREEPGHAHVARWFGTASRKALLLTLELTAARLDESAGIEIHCNDPASCTGGHFAYARSRTNVLGLCPTFFRARMEGQDSRWGILVHEASHLAANTADHAYGPRQALALAKSAPEKAGENGDSIEYFVETMD